MAKSPQLGAQHRRREKAWSLWADLVALAVALLIPSGPLWVRITFVVVVAAGILLFDHYGFSLTLVEAIRLPAVVKPTAIATAIVAVPLLSTGERAIPFVVVLTPLLLLGARLLVASIILRLRKTRGGLRTVVVGAGPVAHEVALELDSSTKYSFNTIGVVDRDDGGVAPGGLTLLGSSGELSSIVEDHGVEVVVIAWGLVRESELLCVLRSMVRSGMEVLYIPRFFSLTGATESGMTVGGIPLQRLRPNAELQPAWKVKRLFDVFAASLLLLLLSPLLGGIAVLVWASGRGPVLFRQTRIGQDNRPFELLKFRTMAVAHDGERSWRAAGLDAGDERTAVGRILRKTSLDELPQLLNVVRGDMSLVGPRPERPTFVEIFERDIPDYADRHRFPVGLTGWAQVHDLRGDTSIPRRVRFDNAYIDEWRPALDAKILLSTVVRVMRDVVSREDRDTRSVSVDLPPG